MNIPNFKHLILTITVYLEHSQIQTCFHALSGADPELDALSAFSRCAGLRRGGAKSEMASRGHNHGPGGGGGSRFTVLS